MQRDVKKVGLSQIRLIKNDSIVGLDQDLLNIQVQEQTLDRTLTVVCFYCISLFLKGPYFLWSQSLKINKDLSELY